MHQQARPYLILPMFYFVKWVRVQVPYPPMENFAQQCNASQSPVFPGFLLWCPGWLATQ